MVFYKIHINEAGGDTDCPGKIKSKLSQKGKKWLCYHGLSSGRSFRGTGESCQLRRDAIN